MPGKQIARTPKLVVFVVLLLCVSIPSISCRSDDSQSKLARTAAQLAQTEDRVAETEMRLAEAQLKLSEADSKIEQTMQELSEEKDRAADLENQLDALSNARDELHNALAEEQRITSELKAQLAEARENISELSSRLDDAKDELTAHTATSLLAGDADDDLARAEAWIEELEAALTFVASIEYFLVIFIDAQGSPAAAIQQDCGDRFYTIEVVWLPERPAAPNFGLPADCEVLRARSND